MSNKKIFIKNCRLIDPYQNLDQHCNIVIIDGIVNSISKDTPPTIKESDFDEVIDGENKWVMPSLVDTNVHLREPGFERKANIESELKAAASGGIGHLACLPSCDPTIDTASLAKSIIHKSKSFQLSHVHPIGALTQGLAGSQLSEMKSLQNSGCRALTNYYHPFDDLSVVLRCYEYAATFDIPVFIYPQCHDLSIPGGVHEGFWSTRLGIPGIPETAETIAIASHLLLIKQTGVRAHFSQLSSADSIEQIADAKAQGLNISCDLAAHQLYLNDSFLQGYDSQYHVIPPLRTEKDRLALIQGLKSGVVDAICSSHQPHELAAKNLPFQASEPGISSIETLLPLALGLGEHDLSMLEISQMISKNPADILGIDRKGIQEGSLADLIIIDTDKEYVFLEKDMISKGKNSPFIGRKFLHKNTATFLDGEKIFSKSS